ncbi:MAG: 4-hydroxythreonine-4-phosphate dehydrogenase PdxA, partial [bacterium]|nr:4-hydroxythreonine-4-phosphate dehydrogenase PdxA [bacterium]
AGLNPHAGEAGLFGQEETKKILPSIRQARAKGIKISGPLAADTLFHQAVHGKKGKRPDAVIALYHDQGLIPLKLLHFKDGVNITLGLPIIRTSPDHGTAFDIAGKGVADPSSLMAAIKMAVEMTKARGPR